MDRALKCLRHRCSLSLLSDRFLLLATKGPALEVRAAIVSYINSSFLAVSISGKRVHEEM